MSRPLHPAIGFGIPILLIVLVLSLPSLVVLAIAELRGVAFTVPLPWAALLAFLMAPLLGVLSPLMALPIKVACVALGAARPVQTVLTTALDLVLFTLGYRLLVRETSTALVMGALTLVVWGIVKLWVDGLEQKLEEGDGPGASRDQQ